MTTATQPALRIALFGWPGAGKSTTASALRRVLTGMGREAAVVRIAAPLYDVQRSFYDRADTALGEGQQDGRLLNFLGSHFRQATPGFLLADFAQRCAGALLGGADAVVCDDARPADFREVAEQGFTVVRVTAPDALRRERKSGRGDRLAGRDDHPTEAGVDDITPDYEIDNSGTLEELESQIRAVAEKLIAHSAAGRADAAPDEDDVVRALIDRATRAITPRYAENRHQIGAAILAADGRVFTGLHVEAMVGRASVCAEAVALGKACEAGATDLRVALAVRHPKPSEADRRIRLVPPCGLCRELLLDYGRDLRTVVDVRGERVLVPLAEMLPHKYVGTKWGPDAGRPPADGR